MPFDQYIMMHAVTATEKKSDKPNIAPFVEWLRKDRPFDVKNFAAICALLLPNSHRFASEI